MPGRSAHGFEGTHRDGGHLLAHAQRQLQAGRTRAVGVHDVDMVGGHGRASRDAVDGLGGQLHADAPTRGNRVHVARILAVGRLVPPIGGRALGRTDP